MILPTSLFSFQKDYIAWKQLVGRSVNIYNLFKTILLRTARLLDFHVVLPRFARAKVKFPRDRIPLFLPSASCFPIYTYSINALSQWSWMLRLMMCKGKASILIEVLVLPLQGYLRSMSWCCVKRRRRDLTQLSGFSQHLITFFPWRFGVKGGYSGSFLIEKHTDGTIAFSNISARDQNPILCVYSRTAVRNSRS